MLEISSTAAQTIEELAGSDQRTGLRIRIANTTDVGAALDVAVTDESGPDDQLVKAGNGAKVFLDPAAALYLTDKVLDAHTDADGKIRFVFHGKV